MTRSYEFIFVMPPTISKPNGEMFTIRGYGNTRRSAERSARSKLRDKKRDPRMFVTLGPARYIAGGAP